MHKIKSFLAKSFSYDEDIKVGDSVEPVNKTLKYVLKVKEIKDKEYICCEPYGACYVFKKEEIRRSMSMYCNYNLLYKIEKLWNNRNC